ncbi:MAG: hypothetical protein JNM56_38745 [Planctomycetia bacterium]|nr:hypothetical protein [Planctomycetia bacterium]
MIQKSTYPNVRPWQPTPEQEAKMRATDATAEWLCYQACEELRPYMGQWIAARDCRVIASGTTLDEVLQQLGDIDLGTVILDRISGGRTIY